jgi:Tfp pilus assembly protein PilZ
VPEANHQRRFPRFHVEGLHGRMVLAAEVDIVNLSLGGMAIKANRRLNIGSECGVTLDVDGRALTLRGTIVWAALTGLTQQDGESVPQYSAGVRFRDVLNDTVESLMEFIDHHKVSEEGRLSGIRFRIRAPGKAVMDGVENYRVKLISRSGMLIEVDRDFEIDQVYPMELQPPDAEPIAFTGRVASRVPVSGEPNPRHDIGIEFQDMPPADRTRLDRFIDSVSQG